MASSKRNPGVGDAGAREIDLLARLILRHPTIASSKLQTHRRAISTDAAFRRLVIDGLEPLDTELVRLELPPMARLRLRSATLGAAAGTRRALRREMQRAAVERAAVEAAAEAKP